MLEIRREYILPQCRLYLGERPVASLRDFLIAWVDPEIAYCREDIHQLPFPLGFPDIGTEIDGIELPQSQFL